MLSNALADYHPLVQLCYFVPVLLFAMLIQQPVILLIMFSSALASALYFGRKKALKLFLLGVVPSALFVCLLNPLFNHAGITILCYLPDGNPFTLESVIYGGAAGCLFAGVLLWCVYLRCTVRTDGILYLFGRIAPQFSLLLSMIFRFLPQFAEQFRQVRAAQYSLGRDITQGSLFRRLKNAVRILSAVIGLSMENAVNTADALKSRGCGLPHRTSFSLYHFERRDGIVLAVTVLCSGVIAAAFFMEQLDFYYFPIMTDLSFEVQMLPVYAAFVVLYGLPLFLQGKEAYTWNVLRSKI